MNSQSSRIDKVAFTYGKLNYISSSNCPLKDLTMNAMQHCKSTFTSKCLKFGSSYCSHNLLHYQSLNKSIFRFFKKYLNSIFIHVYTCIYVYIQRITASSFFPLQSSSAVLGECHQEPPVCFWYPEEQHHRRMSLCGSPDLHGLLFDVRTQTRKRFSI